METEQLRQVMEDINTLLEPEGIKIYRSIITNNEGKVYNQYSSVIDSLASHWVSLPEESKEKIARTIMKTNKNYLGDIKWVLYQYICDIGEPCIFVCGNFAYNKLTNSNAQASQGCNNVSSEYNIPKYDAYNVMNLNGETVEILRSPDIDKKKLEIYAKENGKQVELYFA